MQSQNSQDKLNQDTKNIPNNTVQVSEAAATEEVQPTQASVDINEKEKSADTTNEGSQAKAESNPYVDQAKEISKTYFDFLINTIKTPYQTSRTLTNQKAEIINSIITILLLAFFMPLYSYAVARNIGSIFFTPTIWDFIILPFFLMLLYLGLAIGVKFGVVQLMKVKHSYLTLLNRYASLLIIPTAIIIVANLIFLLGGYQFSLALMTLAITLIAIASILTIFTTRSEKQQQAGIDLYYAILILLVGIALILWLLGDNIFNQFLF